jgi:hypothetical protein
MNKTFPQKESDMYPIIKDFFLKSCDKVFVDGVRLRKNLRIGRVDVTALENPDGVASQIHLIEAKSFAKRQSFEECVNQLEAVRDSGDRLWAAFPENQWNSLKETERRGNVKKLNEHGFGLLLLNPTQCYPEINAPPNGKVTEAGRAEVLQQLGFATDLFMANVQTLGVAEARKAGSIMALISMVADILNEVESKRVGFQRYWGFEYDKDCVSAGWYVPNVELKGQVFCELDPFGCFLGDGVPTAWVGVVMPLDKVFARVKRGPGFGTHVYLDDSEGYNWKTIPIVDGIEAIEYWADRGLNDGVNLIQRIEVLGRMKSSLKSDFDRVIKEARKCKADSL